jgi:acid phosphatase type 7
MVLWGVETHSSLRFNWIYKVLVATAALGCCVQCSGAGEDGPETALKPGITLNFKQFSTGKPMHMVAYGDTRFADPSLTAGTNPRVRKWLVDRIAEEHPPILLITGDTPYHGASFDDWKAFEEETEPWRKEGILVLPTTGNHEVYGGAAQGITNYLDHFPEIERHRNYSALLGNVEVISMDMTSEGASTDKQVVWFGQQLDHVPPQVDFLMILYHMPWMVDEQTETLLHLPSADALLYRKVLEAHLDSLRAKVLVLNGHIHNYERFEQRGVEYVVTGGGGAEPYPLLIRGAADLYHDHPRGHPVYHYLTLDVNGRTLHAKMWRVTDPDASTLAVEAQDEFTLTAPAPAAKAKSKAKAGSTKQ